MYRSFLRPILFLFPPETAHTIAFRLLGLVQALRLTRALGWFWTSRAQIVRPVHAFGLSFINPVGLAAGFDKDARLLRVWDELGFGFVEVGTVTPKAQEGNKRPRLFRLVADRALINRMGFNNDGVLDMARRLKDFRSRYPESRMLIGGNIGKNKITPNDRASLDYLLCMDTLYSLVDFFTVNVSSPNTPGLRDLQEKGPLTALLRHLRSKGKEYAQQHGVPERPILLKIAPDLNENELRDVVDAVSETGINGIIATNTTTDRSVLHSDPGESGGLSGKPLRDRSTQVLQFLQQETGGSIALVGVGGIAAAQDAQEKIDAGARLVQVYTGFVYEGPAMVSRILKGLPEHSSEPVAEGEPG